MTRARLGAAPPLAILAGAGRFPALAAAAVEATGRAAYVVGIEGEATPEDGRVPDAWVRRGQIGRLVKLLRQAGTRDLLLIGAIRQRRLPRWSETDWTGLWTVVRHRRLLAHGDDSVLRTVARLLEAKGCRIVGPAEVAPDLLATHGPIGSRLLPDALLGDARIGLAAARALGRRDAGQAVVVAAGAVVLEEGPDGTDALIGRAAGLGIPAGAGLLVKAAKPQQDRRLDLPAIGPDTVAAAAAAGLAGLVIEAGVTLVADRAEVKRVADAHGLVVAAIEPEGRAA